MSSKQAISAEGIVFGLNRTEDERSLADFLQLFSREELTSALVPRMSDDEIRQIIDLLTSIMRTHLTEKEYHTLFLADPDHPH